MRSHNNLGRFAAIFSLALLASLVCVGFTAAEPIQSTLVQDPNVPGRWIDMDPNGYTIQEVINAGGIIIGDKLFDAFKVTTVKSDGAVAPGAAEIAITPIQILKAGAPFGGDYGLKFNAIWSAPGGGLADSTIEFRVTILPEYQAQGYKLKDNALWITAFGIGGTVPPGMVSVSENVWAQHPSVQPQVPLANKFVYYRSSSDFQIYDEKNFTEPVVSIWVTKDVGANGGEGQTGISHLSEFYQTFSQIPEPGTFVLLAVGLVGLAGFAWRKRR